MKCYYIVDLKTGIRWSRNQWGTNKSIPDLYLIANNAFRQITEGKVSLMCANDPTLRPIIQTVELKF